MKSLIKDMFSKPEELYGSEDDEGDNSHLLPIERVMDPTPYMIQEHMPVQHFYSLFRNVDMNVICVLSRTGKFIGLLTRRGLIAAAKNVHLAATLSTAKQKTQSLDENGMQKALDGVTPTHHCSVTSLEIPTFRYGGLRTPDITDECSSSVYDESVCSSDPDLYWDDDMSELDSSGSRSPSRSPSAQGMALYQSPHSPNHEPRSPRKSRLNSRHSLSSRHSNSVSSSGSFGQKIQHLQQVLHGHAESEHTTDAPVVSHAAMAMAEMMGPNELRAQLASAWSQLAAAEHKQESLRESLREKDLLLATYGQTTSRDSSEVPLTTSPHTYGRSEGTTNGNSKTASECSRSGGPSPTTPELCATPDPSCATEAPDGNGQALTSTDHNDIETGLNVNHSGDPTKGGLLLGDRGTSDTTGTTAASSNHVEN